MQDVRGCEENTHGSNRCYSRNRRRSYPLPSCTLRVFHSHPPSTTSFRSSVGILTSAQNHHCEASCFFRAFPTAANGYDPHHPSHHIRHLAKKQSEFVALKIPRWNEPRMRGDTRSIRTTNEMVGQRGPNVEAMAPEPWIPASQGVDEKEVKSKQNRYRSAGS